MAITRAPYIFEPDHAAWAPLAGAAPISLLQLEPGACSWPVTGGFCGMPTDQRPNGTFRSWCPVHHRRGITAPPPKTRKAK